MKEKVQLAIAGMFAVAIVVFFAVGKVPLNVFLPVITGGLVWLFKDIEQARLVNEFRAVIRSNIDMLEKFNKRLDELGFKDKETRT